MDTIEIKDLDKLFQDSYLDEPRADTTTPLSRQTSLQGVLWTEPERSLRVCSPTPCVTNGHEDGSNPEQAPETTPRPLSPCSFHSIGDDDFNPSALAINPEELRPQPMMKKSVKTFVPDDQKDDQYWKRRIKNNMAAKQSRDARRIKENQIALRAAFLEKEYAIMKEEADMLRNENQDLRTKLAKYESKIPSKS